MTSSSEQQTQTTKCEYIWMFIKLHYRGTCNIRLNTNIHTLNIDANARKAWTERESERALQRVRERERALTRKRVESHGSIYS